MYAGNKGLRIDSSSPMTLLASLPRLQMIARSMKRRTNARKAVAEVGDTVSFTVQKSIKPESLRSLDHFASPRRKWDLLRRLAARSVFRGRVPGSRYLVFSRILQIWSRFNYLRPTNMPQYPFLYKAS